MSDGSKNGTQMGGNMNHIIKQAIKQASKSEKGTDGKFFMCALFITIIYLWVKKFLVKIRFGLSKLFELCCVNWK